MKGGQNQATTFEEGSESVQGDQIGSIGGTKFEYHIWSSLKGVPEGSSVPVSSPLDTGFRN